MLENIFVFIAVLVVLILFHELGHFIVARALGVTVLRFSVGFGKELLGFTHRNIRYSLNLLPLGGYVNLLGEQRCNKLNKNEFHGAFCYKPIWVRSLIISAGPAANFLLGFVFLFCLFTFAGIPEKDDSATMDQVLPDTPASRAGLKPGDKVIEIDGNNVAHWSDMIVLINQSNGHQLNFVINRNDNKISQIIRPEETLIEEKGEQVKKYRIGIVKTTFRVFIPVSSVFEACREAVKTSISFAVGIIKSIFSLLFGSAAMEDVGGPVTMAKMTNNHYDLGLWHLLYLSSLLSINLCLINLIPIPLLDGGHLAGLLIEKLRAGKPLPDKIVFISNVTGQIVLAVILYTVVFNDLVKILK